MQHALFADSVSPQVLAMVFETMSEGVVGFDEAGVIEFCNPAMAMIVGCSVDALVGKTPSQAWDGIDPDVWLSAGTTSLEEAIHRPDGEVRIVVGRHSPCADGYTRIAIYRDITASRLARREANRHGEWLQMLMRHFPGPCYAKDAAHNYVYMNPHMERMFGISRDQWEGRSDFDVLPAETAQRLRWNDSTALDRAEVTQTHETIVSPHGEHRWYTVRMPVSGEGDEASVCAIALDDTDRQRLLHSLEIRTELMGLLLMETSAGIFAIDEDFNFAFAGGEFTLLLSPDGDVIGKSADEIFGERGKRLMALVRRTAAGRAALGVWVDGNGTRHEIRLFPFQSSDKLQKLIIGVAVQIEGGGDPADDADFDYDSG